MELTDEPPYDPALRDFHPFTRCPARSRRSWQLILFSLDLMTPQDLRGKFVSVFPEFSRYWSSDDNLFRGDAGADTLCGVFAAASHFVRERFDSITPQTLDALGSLVEDCFELPDTQLANECGACFLENLAFEGLTPRLTAHLRPRGRAFITALEDEEA